MAMFGTCEPTWKWTSFRALLSPARFSFAAAFIISVGKSPNFAFSPTDAAHLPSPAILSFTRKPMFGTTFSFFEIRIIRHNYIKENPEGPYDMEAVSASYIEKMDTAYAQRKEDVDAFNQSIEDKKASAGNFDALYASANNAGNYMDPDEFQNLKNQTIDYIIGQMLNGEVDTDFLASLSSKYQNDVPEQP